MHFANDQSESADELWKSSRGRIAGKCRDNRILPSECDANIGRVCQISLHDPQILMFDTHLGSVARERGYAVAALQALRHA